MVSAGLSGTFTLSEWLAARCSRVELSRSVYDLQEWKVLVARAGEISIKRLRNLKLELNLQNGRFFVGMA